MNTITIAGRVIPAGPAREMEREAERLYAGDHDAERLRASWVRGAACGWCAGPRSISDSPQARAYRDGWQYARDLRARWEHAIEVSRVAEGIITSTQRALAVAREVA